LNGQQNQKKDHPWNKIPGSEYSWRYVPGNGSAASWGEWHLTGGPQFNVEDSTECALRADTYNSQQIPANCRSSKFPVGSKFCVAGTTYEVTKSWDSGGGSTVNHAKKAGRETIPKGTKITFGSCGSSADPDKDSGMRPGTPEECGRTHNVKKMKSKSEDHRYCRFLSEADGGKAFCENSFRRGTGKKGITRLCYWDEEKNKCDGGERVICKVG
jgi:hypothetical protein